MGERTFKRIFALMMIVVLMSWNLFPVIGYAGEFIKPGKAITPGKSYAPGQSINGGKFIVPGKVYEPGKTVQPGKVSPVSGSVIMPGSPYNAGTVLIPNVPPAPPGSIYWKLQGIEAGDAMQGGSAIDGGKGPNGGKAAEGGEGPSGGKATEGGEGPSGGKATEGGEGPSGGKATEGGEGPSGGKATEGGEGPSGGKATEGGEGPSGGKATEGGGGPNGGKATEGGELQTGNTANSDEIPPWYNVIFKSTDGSKGWFSHVTGAIGDFKTFGLGFLNQNVSGGLLSVIAGFKYAQIGDSSNYAVFGKNGFKNKILDNLYQKYKNYTIDGEAKKLGPNSRRISESRLNSFLDSKKLKQTDISVARHIGNSVVSSINNSWNPFGNPKNWMNKNVFNKNFFSKNNMKILGSNLFNKDFFAKSNMAKLSGPIGYITTAASSVYNYGWGENKEIGLKSTNFAADLTTDVAVGVVSTGIGSVASSMAAGALAGSAVPGLGTVAGAVAGLGAGLVTTYLINGTATGRRLKKAVSGGIKKAYDWVGGGLKKLGGIFG